MGPDKSRRAEAVQAAAVFLLDQAGEGRGGAAAVPGAALGHDAGGVLEAGQPEGDQLPVAGQIGEVFDVHLKQAKGRPSEFLGPGVPGAGGAFCGAGCAWTA